MTVIWPRDRAAVIASVYIMQTGVAFNDRNAAIPHIARALSAVMAA